MPPILDIVFRAHSGSSLLLPLSSNSIIWIRVGDYLHPLPKCQHGMQRWTVSDRNLFLFYKIPWKIILHFTDQIFFAGLLTQPLTRNRWRSGPFPHCSPPSRLACWQGNTSSSEMEILPTLGWKYWGLWAGTTSSPEMGIPAPLIWKHWNQAACGTSPLEFEEPTWEGCALDSAYLPRPFSEGFPQGCEQWQ